MSAALGDPDRDVGRTFASLLLAEGAPITYVSAQLGHTNPSTTLRFYARWIPIKGRRWVEVLDTPGANLEPKVEPKRLFGEGGVTEVVDSEWSRRWDLNPRPADYEAGLGSR